MVSLEQLPYEVTAVVLSHLSSLQDLLVAISSCRHLHTAFEECPAVGADVFLSCFDSSLLPLSLAVAAEEVKFFPRPRMADDVQRFVHALTTDERRLLARLRAMPLSRIFSMSRTEDAIINLTFDFAQEAWMRQEACFGQREVGLSPAETTRFARAFYRLEILVNAFRSEEALSPPELKREGKRWLLTTYLPHEREQIAAAHDYLEKKLGKACKEFFRNDIEFNAMGVDYLTLGVGNPWTQHWVSQGATYIHGLDGTNEAKRKHLVAAFDMAGTSPMQIITSRVKDDPAYFMVPFKMRHGQPVFHSQYPDASGDDDIDPGPWLTWSDEYETLDWTLWSVRRMTAGLREVAYVFWDEDRVNDFELMIIYSSVPNASSNNPGGSPHHVHLFELKMADMRRKFEHSLDLWQQGWTTEWHGDEPRNVRGHPREGKPVPRKSKEDGARD